MVLRGFAVSARVRSCFCLASAVFAARNFSVMAGLLREDAFDDHAPALGGWMSVTSWLCPVGGARVPTSAGGHSGCLFEVSGSHGLGMRLAACWLLLAAAGP